MEVGDFTSTVACFMRLTWAAAAGRLDLVGSPQPIKETHSSLLPQGVRTRVSSTGDTDALPWLLAPDWLEWRRIQLEFDSLCLYRLKLKW